MKVTFRAWHNVAAALVLLGFSGAAPVRGQNSLADASLEQLLEFKVTSVSKKDQDLAKAAAAVYVIRQEDIRRSGATNLPDLLRMAPGVDVEQIDANAWAISIRGFNSRYSNKVLVLIDGRTVYTPSFSGVFWDHLDMPLENIERIEVVRGPGATVWGANAVNGVISIITKSSKDTKGSLASAGAGSQLKGTALMQYGGSAGTSGSYRVFGQFADVGNQATPAGSAANDHWNRSHGGFRTDWDLSPHDSVMVQGDLFWDQENQTRRLGFVPTPYDQFINEGFDAGGGDVLARWGHTAAGGSQTSVQTYFDTYRRTDLGVPEVLRTFDCDFQDHLGHGGRNDVVWGLGYRVNTSVLPPGYAVALTPPSRTDSLFSGFLQDELRVSEALWLTLGTKVEHNAYTGLEVEPSVRMVWTPRGRHYTVWAAASKASRQPARVDTGISTVLESLPLNPYTVETMRLLGNPNVKDEEIRDYELGYRSELSPALSLDVATFLSFYHHLETVEPQTPTFEGGTPLQVIVPMLYENMAHAVDYGGEVSLNWNVNPRWRISPGYAYLHATIRRDAASQGIASNGVATDFPQNMLQIRSLLNLSRKTQFDQSLYYTARLPGGTIPGHARVDLRLARRIGESVEASIVGQNLLRPRTLEYGDSDDIVGTQSVRSIYGKITWRF